MAWDWPDVATVSDRMRRFKERYFSSLTGDEEANEGLRDLHYTVAVSSGKAIGDIPGQIGRRAGWASQQGAKVVELQIENPAMLLMDAEMLVNLADQLDLYYNIHSTTKLGYGMSYMRGREGEGYRGAHEYTKQLLMNIKDFQQQLQDRDLKDTTGGHKRMYLVNAHMAVQTVPPEEEHMAHDVSVGPYGDPIEESRIFNDPDAREQIWHSYLWPEMVKDDQNRFQQIMQEFDLSDLFSDTLQEEILNPLISEGYLPPRGEESQYLGQPYEALDLQNIRQFANNDIREDPQNPESDIAFPAVPQEQYRDIQSHAEDIAEDAAREEMRNMVRADRENLVTVMNLRGVPRELYKESTVFRHLIPYWMPHAQDEPVQQLWENITGIETKDVDELDETIKDGFLKTRETEDIIAAATGAYVWGHFTQEPPGYEKTLMEHVKEADIYWAFESHFSGGVELQRIWKPKDFIEVVKAINSTPIEHEEDGETVEEPIPRARVTIDMEHIATQNVDPMWVVDPDEEKQAEGYKGLDDGDGRLIMENHVTHPYVTEDRSGHGHGPIRRGDTLVYEYLHTLVDRGMCTDPDHPTIILYEIGEEKSETLYMLRLMMKMIEHDIHPQEVKGEDATQVIIKDEPDDQREYLIQEFFGVTDTQVQHEWQEIFEHALDPLDGLLEAPAGGHTWQGRAALSADTRPEEWQQEEYR